MQTALHPKYHDIQITCACGSSLKSRSTQTDIRLDICSACHPFFTGTQKLIDTEGRVERFQKKYGEVKATPPPKPVVKQAARPRPIVAKPVTIVRTGPVIPKSGKPAKTAAATAAQPAPTAAEKST